MVMKNKIYPHRYQPLITKTLFEKVQKVKKGFNKKRSKYAGKPYIYRGLIRCAHCGLAITPEKHKLTTIAHNTRASTGQNGCEKKK